MINAVRGKALEINQNSIVVLADNSVEYYLEVSANCASYFSSLSKEDRENVRVLTVLQHREDNMTLFGFKDQMERFCFNQLQTVPGIGAKGALKILSGISVDNLILALDQKDVKTLSKVPGLGAKTAQKLILQLRNVLVLEEEGEKQSSSISSKHRFADLITSFTEMGYDKKNVVKVIDELLKENELLYSSMSDREIESKILSDVLRRLG